MDFASEPLHVSTEKTARVSVDGNVIEGRTAAMTVGEMLTEWGIFLHENDTSSVPLSSPTVDGMVVMVGRHSTTGGTETKTLPFKTVEVENDEMLKGTKRTVTTGKTGSRVVTYQSIMVDGEEVDREILTEVLVSEPVDEVIHIGTKPVPDIPTVAPGSNRALGREMAAARDWGDDQFKCLDNLWTRESNWRHMAENRSMKGSTLAPSPFRICRWSLRARIGRWAARWLPRAAGAMTSSNAWTICGPGNQTGASRLRTGHRALMAFRRRCPARRWLRLAATGAATRRPKSPGV